MSPAAENGAPETGRPERFSLRLATASRTEAAARALAPTLRPGDAALLSGGLGAGKSTFARAVILARLAAEGRREDAPSPTYTLLQSYETAAARLIHADLYRLSGPDETEELGLLDAADDAILLIEWPDRLGEATPERRLELHFSIDRAPGAAAAEAGRRLDVGLVGPAWEAAGAALRGADGAQDHDDDEEAADAR